MMKTIPAMAVVALAVALLVGCASNQSVLPPSAQTAKSYIEKLAFHVVTYVGPVSTYTLTEQLVGTLPYAAYWKLPGNDPKPVFGKTVEVHKFIVTGHPLDHYRNAGHKSKGQTEVYIHMADGQVVAGTSFPLLETGLAGGYWNVRGEAGDTEQTAAQL